MLWKHDGRVTLRRAGGTMVVAAGMALLVACGGGDNEDPEQEPEVVETVIPTGPTSTPETEEDSTSTTTAEATSTPEATPTATSSPTPVPPTATPTVTPTPTATPLPTVETPFINSWALPETVTNYTLEYSAQFDSSGDDDGLVSVQIQQASPESYHLAVATGEEQTEAWRVGEEIYVRGAGGAVVELPGLVDQNLYAPSSFLALVPDLRDVQVATVVSDDEDVAGRSATHYQVDAEQAAAFRPTGGQEASNVDGTFDVWVDNELGVILQIQVDAGWDVASQPESIVMNYLLSSIGTTPEVAPPL